MTPAGFMSCDNMRSSAVRNRVICRRDAWIYRLVIF